MQLSQKDKDFFEHLGFKIEITEDESPSLRLMTSNSAISAENMHHSKGAAAETNYIYASVIDSVFKCYVQNKNEFCNQQLSTCIVGLGLGYIEISWAQQILKNQISISDKVLFNSFEIVEGLKDHFLQWLFRESKSENSIYDLISYKLNSRLAEDEIRKTLSLTLTNKSSSLESDLADFKSTTKKWNLICYDAFSQKTTHVLWQPDFLDYFLSQYADFDCVFTTYACTSVLKKALQKANFQLIKRPGFGGKRESILALRGVFIKNLHSFQTF